MPAEVGDDGARDVDARPARLAQPAAQVHVLAVHEVRRVEADDGLEGLAAQQHAGAGQPPGRVLHRRPALLAVGARPRVGGPRPAQHRVADAPAERRERPGGGVELPVRGADRRAEAAGVRPPQTGLEQLVERTGRPGHVGVGDDHPLPLRALRPEVRSTAVADVAAGRQQLDAGADRRLGDAVGAAVVGQHDLVRPGGRGRQRVEEGPEGAAGRVGDDDDAEGRAVHDSRARANDAMCASALAAQVNSSERWWPAAPSSARRSGSSSSATRLRAIESGSGSV